MNGSAGHTAAKLAFDFGRVISRWQPEDLLRQAGQPMYFLSNMPAPVADTLLARHGFVGWFDDGVFCGRVGHNKPEAAIHRLAARRCGHPVGERVFLDDHGPKVEAACASGWRALQFHDAVRAEAEVRAAGWL